MSVLILTFNCMLAIMITETHCHFGQNVLTSDISPFIAVSRSTVTLIPHACEE